MTNESIERFISRWQAAGGSERANYQLFVGELTELLGLPQLLDTLVALGRARMLEDGRWMG